MLMFGRAKGSVGGDGVSRRAAKEWGLEKGEAGGCGDGVGDAVVEAFPRKTILAVPDVHSRKPCIKGDFMQTGFLLIFLLICARTY